MNACHTVYELRSSLEEDRPEIDSELEHEEIDWLLIGEILDGERGDEEYPLVFIQVEDPDAESWDFYTVAGTLGLFSERAISAFGEAALRLFDSFEAKLNGESYWFLRCTEPIDCLDRERSVWIPFPHDAERIMQVERYVFKKEMLDDPLLFCLPDACQLFATEGVVRSIENHSLRGLRAILLE